MSSTSPHSVIRPPPVDPDWLKPFLAHCHRRRYPAKTAFIHPGDPADSLFYLVGGQVTVFIEDDDSREIILTYLNKGEFIGEMGLFIPTPKRSVMVRTRTACELAEISYQKLEQLFDGELQPYTKAILYALGRQLTDRLAATSRKVSHLAFLDVTGRIAGTLLELCKQPDAMTHPDGMQIRITRQEIGRIVGCSREMAGRVLKDLEERGLIGVKGKTIVAGAGVLAAHEGLADQEGVHAVLAHQPHVVRPEDAALGNHQAIGRYPLEQAEGGVERDLETAQVAVVDADQAIVQGQRPVQFGAIVDFDQDVHAERRRLLAQAAHLPVVQAGGDQQDTVGTQRPGLDHLVGIDEEILADHRQAARGPGLLQVGIGALEEIDIGQHRQAGRTARGVTAGDGRRVEVFAQDALGRRGALDLGDHGGIATVDAGLQGRGETARRVGFRQGRRQLGQRTLAPPRLDLLGLARDDALQDVRRVWIHRARPVAIQSMPWVSTTRRSSRFRASPDSMAWSARATPSCSDSARPAT